ncbi:unnamed protein product [Durusdinium trenchii]|uniref:EF-hand domain-containing protein n=2 Tax=Durusdinium trenchii TaxID=1381693 RepID=A0ABP0NUA1_9DINO
MSTQALFPLPVPKLGVFKNYKCGSRERKKRAFDRAFHVCVMAFNFWHADYKHIPISSIARTPNDAQQEALMNLKRMLRAFGSSEEEFSVPKSGRRITSLISMLSDLSEFVTWEGLGGDIYSGVYPGSQEGYRTVVEVPRDLDRADELRPYRTLDPSRLTLSGKAEWDPQEYLSDKLWMAFNEPESLRWTASVATDDVPNLSKEKYHMVKDLALLWDVNGLLYIHEPAEEGMELSMRFFNCYKNKETDRMAGLPTGQALLDLECRLPDQRISICASDRKDFYHQLRVHPKRAITNKLFPLLDITDLNGTQAFQKWLGMITVGAPVQKRLALAFVSLTLASSRFSTDALQASLIGGWVNAVLYRRPAMSLIYDLYKTPLSDVHETPRLIHLTRSMAQELLLLSVLCPFWVTDISAIPQSRCYSTDSSDSKGAVVSCPISAELATVLCRTGRKKTTYSRMLTREETLLRKLDWSREEFQDLPDGRRDEDPGPERPRAFRFHFIEVCGGAGRVSHFMRMYGWNVGPVIDIDRSPAYDFSLLRVLQWLAHLIENDLLGSGVAGATQEIQDAKASGVAAFAESQEGLRSLDSILAHPDLSLDLTLWTLMRLADLELPQGRPVLPATQKRRDFLLEQFASWLKGHDMSLDEILLTTTPDIEALNVMLEKYGRELYRHQIARLDHPQLLKTIEVAFQDLEPWQQLWPASPQTMRLRFNKLLKATGLDQLPDGISRGIDLGSLRAGGASWLLLSSEDSEMTRRRGRWITTKVMEIYVQEAWSVQFMPKLPRQVKQQIWNGAQLFPSALEYVTTWKAASIPESAWPLLFLNAARDFELNIMGVKKMGGVVLVVTDGWAGVPGVPNHSTPGKKVVTLPDDTDAKPGGDESRTHRPSIMSCDLDENDAAKTRANLASRMTVSIPHLQKDGFLEPVTLPFWHPGRYVHTTAFDAIFCGVIVANTLVMALEMQYTGLQRGYELGFQHFTMPASEYWPQANLVFQTLDICFGIVYTIELIVKLVGFKLRFFKDWWNIFDGLLVTMWLAEVSLRDVIQLEPGILRMMRMCRLLRLIRLVKTIQGFDALYIMTTAMLGSVVCLFWSFMLLMTVQVMIAFFLNESLEIYFNDPTKPVSEKHEVFEYFGTTARVMLTMFELTLANWPVAARILQENVTEFYSIFSVGYKLIVGFAAVGIINGVFMQETFKVAASDDKLMMRQKERDRWLHTKKMKTLFEAADESGDGYIDRNEFCDIMNIPEVRTWLAAQELPVQDPNVLFNLLDDGDAELTAEELVKGVERLKGTAKGIDLAAFIAEYRSFAAKVADKLDFQLESLANKPKEDDDAEGGSEGE